jgi:Diacylglycerol kinase catalytic domain
VHLVVGRGSTDRVRVGGLVVRRDICLHPVFLPRSLAPARVQARYCSAKSPDFRDALRQPTDLVVIAGGEGTVVKAISHLYERNMPIAILPLGSANNIAGSLGIRGRGNRNGAGKLRRVA